VYSRINLPHPSAIHLISAFKDWHAFWNQLLYRPVLCGNHPERPHGAGERVPILGSGTREINNGHHVGFPEKRTRGRRKGEEKTKRKDEKKMKGM